MSCTNLKKKAQTLAIRSQAHHKPNILWDKSAPLWARSQCIFFCSHLFEVVIRERLSKYVSIQNADAKVHIIIKKSWIIAK